MISGLTLLTEFLIKALIKDISISATVLTLIDIIMISIFAISLYLDLENSSKIKFARTPIILGYLFRILIVFFDIWGKSIYSLPNSGADSEMYYLNSVNYSFTHQTSRGGMFPKVMGTIFSFIGDSRVYGQFIIVLYSIVSLCILARMLSNIDIKEETKYNIMMIISLLPNLAIISSVFLRESIVAMFITLSCYFFFKWIKNGNVFIFVFSFVLAFTASMFHSGSAAITIGYIAVVLMYDRKIAKFKFHVKNIVPAILLLLIVAFLYINYADTLFGKMQNVESISDIANTREAGGSSYAKYVGNSSSPVQMLIFTVPRILYFLFSPFPWQWRGMSDLIAFFFSSLFFMFAVWSDIKFLYSKEKKNRNLVIALTIIAAFTVFVFAWGVSNTGTAVRHRDKLTMIWALILALTHDRSVNKKLNEKKNNPFCL